MGIKTNILLFGVLVILVFSPFYMSYYLSCNNIEVVEYDLEDANEIWNQYDEHNYAKRTSASDNSIVIADKLINNNEIFLLNYWDPYVFDGDELDWSEDPYDDWTWQFYFHSLRMVSYLINAYELTEDTVYLEKAQWFIESWAENNPCPAQQASLRAWDDHSTANRITTFIYFWDHYRDSEIFDNDFANEFLNLLRLHGEYTAKDSNYMWGHNHGIYQDIALMQLAVMFPNFENSGEWLEVGNSRFSIHLETGVTPSGVHKEHSPSYHYLVLGLFLSMSQFNHHYDITNDELDSIVYKMQEYLVHIAKPDGTVPLVGDSVADRVTKLSESKVTNEHLLYLVSDGSEGQEIGEDSIVYQDAGVAIFKNDWENFAPLYFALFNGFHSSVHKQSDDLSFVLTYQDTDYFVDSGKYNFVEKDPYRIFVRSVFAHNTIAVDDESYNVKDPDNVGKTIIENYVIAQNYSFVKASHNLYQGVKVTRSIIFFNDGAVFLHDEIESDEAHKYTQMFNIGDDVNLDVNDTVEVLLSSKKDNGTLTLKQLTDFHEFKTYTGSNDPTRGWQSTRFNEVSPITTLNFELEGKNVAFETVINIELNITEVEMFQHDDKDVYVFKFDDNRTETIEIDTDDEIYLSQSENDEIWGGLLFVMLLFISLGVAITINKKDDNHLKRERKTWEK